MSEINTLPDVNAFDVPEGPIDSILTSVKKNLNIPEAVTAFDPDIAMHINSSFAKLNQMGVGPEETFQIEGKEDEWSDFTTDVDLALVRSYIYLDVRLIFDPPTASVLSSLEKKLQEYEWRLNVASDTLLYGTDQNGTDIED